MIDITYDKPDALYHVGEKAKFTVKFSSDNDEPLKGIYQIKVSNDGGYEYQKHTVTVTGPSTFTFEQGVSEPGFVRMDVTDTAQPELKSKDNELEIARPGGKVSAVAFDPLEIQGATPEPDCFWKFWQDELKKTEETIPLDAKMELLPEECDEAFNCYEVSFAAPNGRVYGFLSVPVNSGKYPVVVATHGTGPGFGEATKIEGCVCLVLNANDYDPRTPGKTVEELFKESNTPVFHFFVGGYDPRSYYFFRSIIGMVRAVNWLAEQPYVNAAAMGYNGASQGGGFGFYLCALTKKFSYMVVSEPGMCDLKGRAVCQRGYGWIDYRRVFRILDERAGKSTDEKAIDLFEELYDPENFASHINKDCIVRCVVGFLDFACPPSGVYAAYNNLAVADKQIFNELHISHSGNESFNNLNLWMQEELRKKNRSVFES